MDEFVSLVIGYFLGNILFAMIVTKIFLHKDPTKYGSGNPGTANVGAVLLYHRSSICEESAFLLGLILAGNKG